MQDFKSEHGLAFEVAPWITHEFSRFRIGTCEGLWRSTKKSYDILAITNDKIGNGHLNDVFQWFENSCKRDKKSLRVLELWNEQFKQPLINKRGFTDIGNASVERKFKK